ncbi:MAG TPA: tripartite tricarboxylate transporter substrate binding protein [Burkholderiales bacterium]|nr:tripartite tricarboxylate transporter substrate binding protein [Burkholderiales bacterium]
MTHLSGLMFVLLALVGVESPAAQTNYPEKPIRLVVGFPIGGEADTVARLLSQKLTGALGKPIVVDNAPGAAGAIGAERVAKAAPDGYTLGLLSQGQIAINPSLYKLAYDPVKDFAPISQVMASMYMLVVHNAVPAKSVKELVALAKAQPGGLAFASAGSGSGPHVGAELFKSMAGLDIRHIPYKGVPAAIPDLLGGRVTMTISPIGVVLPLAREGKLRALAVTSLKRSSLAPELPTIAESGYPSFELMGWLGLLAPSGTPAVIVRRLHVETIKALALPDLRAKLADLALEGIGNSPDEFAAFIKSEIPKWAKVVKESGIKPD